MDLSVIIPACGMQRYIAACLRSVTRCPGNNMDMECIVVSDGSNSETAAVVNRYMERDNRIKLIILETGETSDARNIGIEKASGRYLLFLDAADRLCEDAWEQIEAAVEEEYADFVAFSYITSRENGKLKAQMLPISDVISSDEREARRLMYADSVLDTCGGKLFKSRIIRDNNIFFQTELIQAQPSGKSWSGVDFLFVAEYFEHSESYLLTKAMILYCFPKSRGGINHYSIKERMDLIQILYDYHVSAVKRYNDSELMDGMKMYFLKMLTDLFGEYVEMDAFSSTALEHEFLNRFLSEVDEQKIHSKIRRHEYRLLREGSATKIRRFYAIRTGNPAKIIRAMKVSVVVLGTVLLMGGCGKKPENTNLIAGMQLVEAYDFQGAIESFETALLNSEDLELSYRGQGIAYMGLGNYAEAETAFLKSIENAQNKPTALVYDTNYYLASAYMKQGKYADAEKIYSAIIGLKRKEKDAYYLRACAVLRQNRYDEAEADFEEAFALDPSDLELVTDAYVEMQAVGFGEQGKSYLQEFMTKKEKDLKDGEKGIIYYYLEDYESARRYLDPFVNGNDAELSLILGQTYEKLGDMNYAAVVYQTYLDANEPDAAIYNSLGICLMHQQKYDEAVEAFENGIAMGASDYLQELKFNRIVASEYTGEFAQAKTMMEEYLQIYPDDERAKKENEFLKTR